MDTIFAIVDFVMHLIFNWTTYLWGIPVFMILWALLNKYVSNDKIKVGDLPLYIFVSLLNPIWNMFLVMAIFVIPLIYLGSWLNKYWTKIKDIEII